MKIVIYNCGRLGFGDVHDSFCINECTPTANTYTTSRQAMDKYGRWHNGYVFIHEKNKLFNSGRLAIAIVKKAYPKAVKKKIPEDIRRAIDYGNNIIAYFQV